LHWQHVARTARRFFQTCHNAYFAWLLGLSSARPLGVAKRKAAGRGLRPTCTPRLVCRPLHTSLVRISSRRMIGRELHACLLLSPLARFVVPSLPRRRLCGSSVCAGKVRAGTVTGGGEGWRATNLAFRAAIDVLGVLARSADLELELCALLPLTYAALPCPGAFDCQAPRSEVRGMRRVKVACSLKQAVHARIPAARCASMSARSCFAACR